MNEPEKQQTEQEKRDQAEWESDMQRARARMLENTQGSGQWWVAYYDLRKAESRLG